MKKIISLLLILALIVTASFSLISCKDDEPSSSKETSTTQGPSTTQVPPQPTNSSSLKEKVGAMAEAEAIKYIVNSTKDNVVLQKAFEVADINKTLNKFTAQAGTFSLKINSLSVTGTPVFTEPVELSTTFDGDKEKGMASASLSAFGETANADVFYKFKNFPTEVSDFKASDITIFANLGDLFDKYISFDKILESSKSGLGKITSTIKDSDTTSADTSSDLTLSKFAKKADDLIAVFKEVIYDTSLYLDDATVVKETVNYTKGTFVANDAVKYTITFTPDQLLKVLNKVGEAAYNKLIVLFPEMAEDPYESATADDVKDIEKLEIILHLNETELFQIGANIEVKSEEEGNEKISFDGLAYSDAEDSAKKLFDYSVSVETESDGAPVILSIGFTGYSKFTNEAFDCEYDLSVNVDMGSMTVAIPLFIKLSNDGKNANFEFKANFNIPSLAAADIEIKFSSEEKNSSDVTLPELTDDNTVVLDPEGENSEVSNAIAENFMTNYPSIFQFLSSLLGGEIE